MGTKITKSDERITVIPDYNLDTKGSADLQNAMNEILEGGANTRIVIDFSSVPFVSSAGLKVLLLAMKKINAAGGALELHNVSDSIIEVFNVTGFSSILKIV